MLVCASNAEVAQFHAAEKGGQIRLTSSSYDRLLSSPRNYSVSVLLTAMAPQFGCGPCAQFAPEHAAVAQAWKSTKDKQGNEHFFAVLDFMEGREVFAKVRISFLAVKDTQRSYGPTARTSKCSRTSVPRAD